MLEGLDALEQAYDHFDSRQVDAQVALQPADPPQPYDLFLAIAQSPASFYPLDQAPETPEPKRVSKKSENGDSPPKRSSRSSSLMVLY